jgi:hypothetical protein
MKALFVASALLFGLVAAPASASDEELKINNRTGYTINEIYLAPASSDNWEEDVMGKQTLETGTFVNIDMSESADTCKWDLKAVYDDKTSAIWHGINLCKISSISLYYNAKTDVTTARYE